jgi:hypothetical protein
VVLEAEKYLVKIVKIHLELYMCDAIVVPSREVKGIKTLYEVASESLCCGFACERVFLFGECRGGGGSCRS